MYMLFDNVLYVMYCILRRSNGVVETEYYNWLHGLLTVIIA